MKIKLIWLLIITVFLFGIFSILGNYDPDDSIRFGFSNLMPDASDDIVFLSIEELTEYTFEVDNYNTQTYYSKLSDTEKHIYLAYRYAFENSYRFVMIDNRLKEKTERVFEDMLYFLSLDSPVVEQNIRVIKYNYTWRVGGLFVGSQQREMSVHEIDIFTEEKLSKKLIAIDKANGIIGDMPIQLTLAEKAEWLYRYLGENVKYDASLSRDDSDYLYNALVDKKTQCDGFANSFSLLLNMTGIPCFEKINKAPEGEEGHTWNTFLLDGKWYNADATAYYQIASYNCPVDMFFGYSDDFQTSVNLYPEMLPVCNDILNLSCSFKNEKDSGLVKEVAYAYENSDGYVVFKFEDRLEKPDSVMAMISGYIGGGVSYISIDNRLFCIYRR